MNDRPDPRDLVELPGPFTFKIVIDPKRVSERDLLRIVKEATGRELPPDKVGRKESSKGKYRSFTITPHFEVYDEIEAVYAALKQVEGVIWAL